MPAQKANPLIYENIQTAANIVTAFRLLVCTILFIIAFHQGSYLINLIGLLVYWGLDVLDGNLARRKGQETLLGAQMDVLGDRLLVILFYANYLIYKPNQLLPVFLFLFEFVFLDAFLSIQFLNWDIISPNYFYKVDRKIWILNWSAPAKALNSGFVTVLLIFTDNTVIPLIAVSLLIAVKVFSFVRLQIIIQRKSSF